jgi:hypothetical protein
MVKIASQTFIGALLTSKRFIRTADIITGSMIVGHSKASSLLPSQEVRKIVDIIKRGKRYIELSMLHNATLSGNLQLVKLERSEQPTVNFRLNALLYAY